MKLAIVTPYGGEERLDNYAEFLLAKESLKRGYQILFFTYKIRSNHNYSKDAFYKGVSVRRCGQLLGLSPKLIYSILCFRPEAVLLFHPRSELNLSAYLAARLIGAKVISEIVGILHDPFVCFDRDNPIETLNNRADLITSVRKLLRYWLGGRVKDSWNNFLYHYHVAQADAVVAISEDEKQYIRKLYHREAVVIPWAMPKNAMDSEVEPEIVAEGSLPKDFLFFIGQIKKRKGWDTVLECLKSLKEKGVVKHLVFISPYSDVSEAKLYAEKLGIENQVIFLSCIGNKERNWLYKRAQYILAPSRYEGFGLPVFEAFRSGRPVLGTDIPVYLEFLQHRKNAMISKIGDPIGLAENIIELDSNPELVQSLIVQGYKTADNYTVDLMTDKFLDLIEATKFPI